MRKLENTLKEEYKYYLWQKEIETNRTNRCFLKGSVSTKTIAGKKRSYLQFTHDHHVKSIYLTGDEAQIVKRQLDEKQKSLLMIEEINNNLTALSTLLPQKDIAECIHDVETCYKPIFPEPSLQSAIGLAEDHLQLYFWVPKLVNPETHTWKYFLSFRYKKIKYEIECGILHENIRHNIATLQLCAGCKVDDFIYDLELQEVFHE